MSRTVCTYPIAAAILKADDILGRERVWCPTSPTQKRYLRDFHAPQAAEVARIPEIESLASFSAADINAWLAARRFQIQLDPFPKHGFGTASVLDVAVQWLEDGLKRPIALADSRTQVPGVLLKTGVALVEHSRLGVVGSIETKSGDIVNFAASDTTAEGMDLMDLVTEPGTTSLCRTYRGVVFPMVDLDEKPDISWLIKLNTIGEDTHAYEIAQAVQQTKFKMNDKGARAKSAVAIGMKRTTSMGSVERPPYVIDRPFLVWIERPGLSKPFFVGHITESEMKDPGSLDDM